MAAGECAVDSLDLFTDGTLTVATGEPGLVAVGHDGAWSGSGGPGQPAAVWTSPNGLTWTRVPDQEQPPARVGQPGLGLAEANLTRT